MPKKTEKPALSPTVLKVLDEFAEAARADDGISNDAVARIEALFKKGQVASVNEITTALFENSEDEKNDSHF